MSEPTSDRVPTTDQFHSLMRKTSVAMGHGVDAGLTPKILEQILSDAFFEPLHAWSNPEPNDGYWTHVLDANSRHKLARIAVEIVWPLTEKARRTGSSEEEGT